MALTDHKGLIWLDGNYLPWADAKVHVLSHTLHYGAGVFEGTRAYKTEKGTAIFRLYDHTKRLFNSAHILGIKIPYTEEELNTIQLEIIRKNNLPSAYLRPMVFYGAESLGVHASDLTVHAMVAAWEWGAYLGEENVKRGIRMGTSSYRRHSPNSALSKAKASGNYVNSVLAVQEAKANGFDEALLLDNQGIVAEGSAANVFIVRRGIIYTPEAANILEGITRDTVFKLAADLGLSVQEKAITRDELYIADEAFLTGTAVEITPIREIDNRTIGKGQPGEITKKLQQAFFDLVHGKSQGYSDWFVYI